MVAAPGIDGNQPRADRSHDEREDERRQQPQHDQRSRRGAEELGVQPGRQFRAHQWMVTGKCGKTDSEGESPPPEWGGFRPV